jgi:hypothetical protein
VRLRERVWGGRTYGGGGWPLAWAMARGGAGRDREVYSKKTSLVFTFHVLVFTTTKLAALSFASRDPMTVAPGGLAIFLGRLTPPPIMWPRLRNVKRGTLFVLAARTDPSIMTLLLCKNRSFNFQRPMLDQTHPHTHIPYQTRFQACVFSNGASGRLSQQSIPDMAVSGQEVATWEKVGPEERIGGDGLLKHDRVRWQGL